MAAFQLINGLEVLPFPSNNRSGELPEHFFTKTVMNPLGSKKKFAGYLPILGKEQT